MVRKINNLCIKNSKTILLFLIISSAVYLYLGNHIKEKAGLEHIHFLSDYSFSQPEATDHNLFHAGIDKIKLSGVYDHFRAYFLFDFFWGLFFLMSLYLYTMALSEKKRPYIFLMAVLLIAYLLDTLENYVYLSHHDFLIKNLRTIDMVKIIFYQLGILTLFFFFIKRIFFSKSNKTHSSL